MSSEELNRVHRRYMRVSNEFKSAWTFHQFIQGARRVFTHLRAADQPGDFQSLYSEIKEVSTNLSETTVATAAAQLDRIEEALTPLTRALLEADEEISPAQLRMFFQRVKSYDEGILTHLIKFYLYSNTNGDWSHDRLDKADYLATKVAEEYNDDRHAFVLRDPTFVREAAQGFWSALGAAQVAEGEVALLQQELRSLGEEFRAAASIDDLQDRGLIVSYRELKHRLGNVFFHPQVLQTILEVNLALKNQIHDLYRREEPSIIAEYQQIFELERDAAVDLKLGEELTEFRAAVDRFEQQLEGENVRLAELAQLRRRVRDLVPKLMPQSAESEPGTVALPLELGDFIDEMEEETAAVPAPVRAPIVDDEHVERQYEAIVATLDNTDSTADARKVALQPEVFGLGLSARDIVAYRRLFSDSVCNRELEEFVLRAAAMRCRIEQEVDAIKGILDDTAVTRDAPQYAQARETVRLADFYLRQFEHRLEMVVLDADGEEARALQLLKMRMMRAYSGLWLMVYRD